MRNLTQENNPVLIHLMSQPMANIDIDKRSKKFFTENAQGKPFLKEDIFTVKDFLISNDMILTHNDLVMCSRSIGNQFGFTYNSSTWKKIKSYLLMKGFTHYHCAMLFPELGANNILNYSLDDLKKIPVHVVGKCILSSESFRLAISGLNSGKIDRRCLDVPLRKQVDLARFSVQSLLLCDSNRIMNILSNRSPGTFYIDVIKVSITLGKIQLKLAEAGFTTDYPFMKVFFSRKHKALLHQKMMQ